MSSDITDFVQSAFTGGARGILGELAVCGIDEARFIQMFVEAGEMGAGYEYYKTEENDFRARLFDKENMVALAKMMRSIDDFSWRDRTTEDLLRWHVNKYEEKEDFELNCEIHTLWGGSSGCISAYRFYRLLDRLALPLRCQYVTLLGEWEHPWIEAVLELNNALGVFLLCKTSRSKIIETLVDREYLSTLSNEEAKRIVLRLIHAFSGNLDEIEDREDMPGGMIAQIFENVAKLLVRFMLRCPEEDQREALLMLKALCEVQPDSYEGVQCWKAVACDQKEINEVKDEWVW